MSEQTKEIQRQEMRKNDRMNCEDDWKKTQRSRWLQEKMDKDCKQLRKNLLEKQLLKPFESPQKTEVSP